jgi:hypothetical protein
MAEARGPARILEEMDVLFNNLMRDLPADQRALSSNLYLAAVSVAIHGCDQVSKELAKRALMRGESIKKRASDRKNAYQTKHAVRASTLKKNRVPSGDEESAFEAVAREQGISASTAEKRRYRKT